MAAMILLNFLLNPSASLISTWDGPQSVASNNDVPANFPLVSEYMEPFAQFGRVILSRPSKLAFVIRQYGHSAKPKGFSH